MSNKREGLETAHHNNRGRKAEAPRDIPAKGWKDVLLRVKREITADHLSLVAAGVTFYALLALFPLVAALVSIFGFFADPGTISQQLQLLKGVLPGGALEIIEEQLSRVSEDRPGKLSLLFFGSLLLSLWSANKGMKAIFEAMNIAYDEDEERGFLWINAVSLLFTILGIVSVLAASFAIAFLPALLERLGLGKVVTDALLLARWPLLFLGIMVAVACVYRYGPSRSKPQWRWVTWGSVGAAVFSLLASLLFSWYAENFGSFNETYGSLGAAIGLMTWIWISTLIILIGAEVNAEMEHQTTEDTTSGQDEPIGERGAFVADTLGQSQ